MAATCDVIVIGAGIMGLSVAHACRVAGLSVRVVDSAQPGAGASGGPVGALVPFQPDGWTAQKAFQYAALAGFTEHVATLEDTTGIGTGFARTGRVRPLLDEAALLTAERQARAAETRWPEAELTIRDQADEAGWPGTGALGFACDTLSARIDPVRYLAALAHDMDLRSGVEVGSVAAEQIETTAGIHHAAHVIVAAGTGSFPLLAPFSDCVPGAGVKGQAARLGPVPGAGRAVVTHDGLYIVPHADGTVGVGSTTEREWTAARTTDAALDDVVDRARAMCPILADAPVLARWAGLRPRAKGRHPMIGKVPGPPGLWVATGGFGISFGIAHLAARALAAMIVGDTPETPLPDIFDPAPRLRPPVNET